MNNDGWTPERVELVKRAVCPKGISDDAFALFMEQCRRSGLDPLLKQAFCVERRQNIGNRDKPNWVNKHEFQPAEAGMLARAEQFPGFEGITSAEVYAEDPITIDYGTGTVEHRVNPAQRKGALVGAWARVQRKGKVPLVVWVDFAAVNQPTPLWGKMPAVMCRKCARVAALRTAYPEAFGGMYVAGERPDDVDAGDEAEVVVPIERPALSAPAPRETLDFATTAGKEAVRLSREGDFDKAAEVLNAAIATPAPREPGSDDDADDIDNEALAIVRALESVTTLEEYKPLRERAVKLPTGTDARKRASDACVRAHKRITGGK